MGRVNGLTVLDAARRIEAYAEYSTSGWLERDVAHERIDGCASRDFLELVDRELVARIQSHEDRQDTIERKATMFIGVIGLCITLLTTLGLRGIRVLAEPALAPWQRHALVAGVVVTALLGACTAVYALFALRTRRYMSLNDEMVLNERAIAMAGGGEDRLSAVDGSIPYLKVLAKGRWEAADTARTLNDRKAVLLRRSQIAFLFFLVSVLAVGTSFVLAGAYS